MIPPIPTQLENPYGLHQRYVIKKLKVVQNNIATNITEGRPILSEQFIAEVPVDDDAEYFIMRLDYGGSDLTHIKACRKAVLYYAELIKDHLPELSKDLIERYSVDAGEKND